MKKLLFWVFIYFIMVSCNQNRVLLKDEKLVQLDSNKIEFIVPKNSKEVNENLKKAMMQMNKSIMYLASCEVKGSKNIFFMVSKYTSNYKTSIEEAFAQSVNTTVNIHEDTLVDNSRVIDFKKYKIQEQVLHYKISKHFDKTYTIMFYFMKDDYSNQLYEIKVATDERELSKCFKFLESVALSVRIK